MCIGHHDRDFKTLDEWAILANETRGFKRLVRRPLNKTWLHVRWLKPQGESTIGLAKMKMWKRYTSRHWYQPDNHLGDELLDPDNEELALKQIFLLPSCAHTNLLYQNHLLSS